MGKEEEKRMGRQALSQIDYSDFLMNVPDGQSRHIAEGGLTKGGSFLEIYHIATKKSAVFKAFLTSFSDNFAASYRAESAYGRTDPYQMYEGNSRTISVAFQVPAFDILEAENNLAKISLLASMLYPTYEGVGGKINALQLRSPPIVRVKFSNLIANTVNLNGGANKSGLAGVITGLSVNPNLESGFFIDQRGGQGDVLLPQLFDLSFEFTVIHEHTIGTNRFGNALKSTKQFPYGVNKKDTSLKDWVTKTSVSTDDNTVTGVVPLGAPTAQGSSTTNQVKERGSTQKAASAAGTSQAGKSRKNDQRAIANTAASAAAAAGASIAGIPITQAQFQQILNGNTVKNP